MDSLHLRCNLIIVTAGPDHSRPARLKEFYVLATSIINVVTISENGGKVVSAAEDLIMCFGTPNSSSTEIWGYRTP